MGFDQYHEPPEELSPETRTFARMMVSLVEEAAPVPLTIPPWAPAPPAPAGLR